MGKIELVLEKLGAFGIHIDEDTAVINLVNAVHTLELQIRASSVFKDDPEQDAYTKMCLVDVAYNLFIIASKRGLCIDCLADDLSEKIGYKMKEMGISILVPTPKVTNTNNTGGDGVKEAD